MALHILQPGLRPIGQFDLKAAQTVTGGEIGVFEADANTGNSTEDPAAADALQVGPLSGGDKLMVALGQPAPAVLSTGTASQLRFLLDDGTEGYGTLMGSAIGGTAGLGVTYGRSASGAVVAIGPTTHFASGKVTCWHAPGLYAIDGTALTGTAVNTTLYATSAGLLSAVVSEDSVAIAVGDMNDDSLVSTTLAAAGESAAAEKFAFYFLGQK